MSTYIKPECASIIIDHCSMLCNSIDTHGNKKHHHHDDNDDDQGEDEDFNVHHDLRKETYMW